MTLGKVLFYFGIVLIVYTFISSFHFYFNMDDSGSEYGSYFSFKAGKVVIGIILIVLGRRLERA